MTTAFKNLVISYEGNDYEVQRVFGSPGKEYPKKPVLIEVNMAFPSDKENPMLTKGGIIIAKINKLSQTPVPLKLKIQYQDRNDKLFEDSQTFNFPDSSTSGDFWQVREQL